MRISDSAGIGEGDATLGVRSTTIISLEVNAVTHLLILCFCCHVHVRRQGRLSQKQLLAEKYLTGTSDSRDDTAGFCIGRKSLSSNSRLQTETCTKPIDVVHTEKYSTFTKNENSRECNCWNRPTEHTSCRTSPSVTVTFGDRLRAICPSAL